MQMCYFLQSLSEHWAQQKLYFNKRVAFVFQVDSTQAWFRCRNNHIWFEGEKLILSN